MFNSSDSDHACSSNLSTRLISVYALFVTSENENSVVAKVLEVTHEHIERLFFAFFEEAIVLIAELSDELGEEMECIHLILRVCVHACRDVDNVLENLVLREDGEETRILSKIGQNCACIDCLVNIVTVSWRKHAYKRDDNLGALVSKNFLHLLLL